MPSLFRDLTLNPKTFYSLIPSEYSQDSASMQSSYEEEDFFLQVSQFFERNLEDLSVESIKKLIECLFFHFNKIKINKTLEDLSLHFSLLYSSSLFNEEKREIRMWIQYANYCLRDLIERDRSEPFLSETTLNFNCPWDILSKNDSHFLISSDKYNFFYFKKDKLYKKHRMGLPTQIDFLGEESLSIGSYYTNGGYVYNYKNNIIDFFDHDFPIVLFFSHDQNTFFLDSDGKVFLYKGKQKQVVFDLETKACRARFIKGLLYVMNWKMPFKIITFDIDHKISSLLKVPTILTNDLVESENYFYLIDKQQGNVFKTDNNFVLLEKKLSFGKREGKLIDPISIRIEKNAEGENLMILNWVCSRLVKLRMF